MTPTAGRAGSVLRWGLAGALVLFSVLGIAMAFPDFVSRHVVPHFLYLPARAAGASPAEAGLPHGREVRFAAEDGVELHAWWIPAGPAGGDAAGREDAPDAGSGPAGPGCGAVVFLHGNAGTLAGRAFLADRFSRRGFGVLLVDYRGYGLSEGTPGEEGLYRDGRAAYRYVRRELGRPPEEIVLAGHSLGSAVAARVAADVPAGAVVLTGAFRTIPELARHAYPFLPDPLFRGWTTNRYEVLPAIRRVEAPVLVARGGLDALVPRSQSRAVYEEASGPKRWFEAPAAAHDDLWDDEAFWDEATSFLAGALGCPDPRP